MDVYVQLGRTGVRIGDISVSVPEKCMDVYVQLGRTGVRIGDISVSVLLGIGVVNLRSRRGA